jgi:acetate CoA/acetoacetate CoA-transferase alpha subunit
MAMAGTTVIAEAAEIVPVGVIPPDEVVTPSVLVDYLVAREKVNGR